MEIKTGKIRSAQKLILYAPEGFGKSTFASKFPDPLFIDTEGSTKQLDVKRFDGDMTWEKILEAADYVIQHPESCKTLVVDTVDWAESACLSKLNKDYNTSNILTMDYGKGSLLAVAEFQKLIDKLDRILSAGKNIVLLAHARMEKQELPEEIGAFDHWGLKLQSKQIKALVKEWADIVLFGNYKTFIVTDDKTKNKKAQGNKRVMYTEHHACWDAKNRHGLAAEIPFEYKSIANIFGEVTEAGGSDRKQPDKIGQDRTGSDKTGLIPEELVNVPTDQEEEPPFYQNATHLKLLNLMKAAHVTEDEVIYTFHQKGKFENVDKIADLTDWTFIERSVVGNWNSFIKAVAKYAGDCPFLEKEDK